MRIFLERKLKAAVVAIWVLCNIAYVGNAQTATSSPYSRYGIGDLNGKGFAQGFAMAGTHIAMQNDSLPMFFINTGNPASYSSLRLTTVDLGLNYSRLQLQNSTAKSVSHSAALGYISIAFPFKKWWGGSIGLIPYSSVGYKVSDQQSITNVGTVDFLYEGTIRENILFPRPNASEEQLLAAVKGAYVNEFTDRFDEGLDTVIGERGVKLSGGQRQRISIARALLADPKVIILDEATSNLDTESESFIQKSLQELMKDRTTFVIAHRLSTIQKADQILVIENGNIVERGNHDALIATKGRYWELFTYQSRI